MNNYDSSEYYQNQALALFTEIDHPYGKSLAKERLGQIYLNKNQFLEALKYYYLALQINQANGFEWEEATSLYHIGITQFFLSNYQQAVEYMLRSLKYWEKINNRPNIWNCNELIGNIYIQIKDFDKALQYHRIALAIQKKTLIQSN